MESNPTTGVFPTSHLLFCPARAPFQEADLGPLQAIVERCPSKRDYVPSHWHRTARGLIEARVPCKGGPHEALAAVWALRHADMPRGDKLLPDAAYEQALSGIA